MSEFPEIAVGTYEEFILGYKPLKKAADDNVKVSLELSQSFASHSHQASIRCVAAHGKYLVSSGADEYINVYDLLLKEVLTVINFHTSTVTCLEFVPDGSYLISANQKGDIAIFSSKDWSLVKFWKEAHKSANGVVSLSVHPSGGLLLSGGADNIMRFWNLIKGRQSYAVNITKKCSPGNNLNICKWSKTGSYYIICIGKQAEIYITKSAAIAYIVNCSSKISSVDFSASNILVIGLDNGEVQVHNLKKKKLMHQKACHKTRVKSLKTFTVSNKFSPESKSINYFITADSGGVMKLWRLRIKDSIYSFILKAQVDADCRITCLTTVQPEVKEEACDIDSENT